MAGDITFEGKFAQLASNQISERVPALVEHRVGFQLIDKNEEETKAVGIAAFVVNKLFLYIPVFFIEGDLKGMELLYIYQSDLFVPASDNWISMLQQEGIDALGKIVPQDRDKNTDKFYGPEEVNLARYPSSFTYKRASLDSGNSYIDSETMDKMLTERERSELPDLVRDLPKLGKQANEHFISTMLNRPNFANALLQWYSRQDIEKMAQKAVADIYAKRGEPKKDEVIFITNNADENLSALGNSEKKLLLRNGVYILDHRTNFSKVFQTDIDTGILQNPVEPGVYDVMMADGEYRTFIIILPEVLDDCEDVYRRHKRNVDRKIALIDIDKPTEYYCCSARKVLCRQSDRIGRKEIDGLRGGDDTTKQRIASIIASQRAQQVRDWGGKANTQYVNKRVLIVQSPNCSFETELYQDPKMTEARLRGGTGAPFVHESSIGYGEPWDYNIEITPEEGNLSVSGDTVLVPEGCRIFVKNDDSLAFGTTDTVSRMMYKRAADFKRLTVSFQGGHGSVRFEKQASGMLNKVDVLKELVLRHGVEASTAMKLLKQAEDASLHTKDFLIKHAAPYDVTAYGMSKLPFMGGPAGVVESGPTFQDSVRGGAAMNGPEEADGTPLLPEQVIERASAAAGQGIKEVFDVSVLGGLVDVADMSEIRKDYITQMIQGMDSVGRMLFLYYWHKEEFENRYGDIDMKNLENTLRTVFESTGDLILFLREKTVYHPEFSESMFGALSEDVGTAALEQ
jgi:hypothetical protein